MTWCVIRCHHDKLKGIWWHFMTYGEFSWQNHVVYRHVMTKRDLWRHFSVWRNTSYRAIPGGTDTKKMQLDVGVSPPANIMTFTPGSRGLLPKKICKHSSEFFYLHRSIRHAKNQPTMALRCIWAHRAYARVGSKSKPCLLNLLKHPYQNTLCLKRWNIIVHVRANKELKRTFQLI